MDLILDLISPSGSGSASPSVSPSASLSSLDSFLRLLPFSSTSFRSLDLPPLVLRLASSLATALVALLLVKALTSTRAHRLVVAVSSAVLSLASGCWPFSVRVL
ncbi:hypothetical protein BDK51DRAFT_46639 [Blyttiomyces helicus]|uniref:Uncharacterized protein n=1 Tax=Blyttiomyces helicus TaxID=388810 RepID=A0A4P9WGA9_9FUNG|nr:hypothetical protein BDK51DRAFT_46639 [Blyttiomyces helicus]|eukprot:RKO90388.1 hypothetical protein BDK51DRAFT_46639 [Blyttiomyces helicus]